MSQHLRYDCVGIQVVRELVQGYLAAMSYHPHPGKAEQNNISPGWDKQAA